MKTSAALIVSLLFAGSALADPVNTKCPVSGKAVDKEQTSTYAKVVGFCCGKCLASFKKDPEAKADKIVKFTATHVNTKCPISGKAVDEDETVTHDGKIVALCCGKCVKKMNEDPAAIMAKVTADNPANDKCPVSGKAVDAEKYAEYTKVVGFCCGKCKKKFDKDPDALIGKVAS